MSQITEAAAEAVAIAKGEIPAARIYHQGHAYVPEAELTTLREEVERLKDMVRRAYNDGFGEGMREHTTHRGGTPWSMSKWPALIGKEQG